MDQGWTAILAAVLATMFFAVYGLVMLFFPHRIRDRRAAAHPRRTTIALRVFGALLLMLCAVIIWAASQPANP